MFNQWDIRNEKWLSLIEDLSFQDMEKWDFDFSMVDSNECLKNLIVGAKMYLLNEKLDDLPQAKKKYQR